MRPLQILQPVPLGLVAHEMIRVELVQMDLYLIIAVQQVGMLMQDKLIFMVREVETRRPLEPDKI
jgi:hypothetical protein